MSQSICHHELEELNFLCGKVSTLAHLSTPAVSNALELISLLDDSVSFTKFTGYAARRSEVEESINGLYLHSRGISLPASTPTHYPSVLGSVASLYYFSRLRYRMTTRMSPGEWALGLRNGLAFQLKNSGAFHVGDLEDWDVDTTFADFFQRVIDRPSFLNVFTQWLELGKVSPDHHVDTLLWYTALPYLIHASGRAPAYCFPISKYFLSVDFWDATSKDAQLQQLIRWGRKSLKHMLSRFRKVENLLNDWEQGLQRVHLERSGPGGKPIRKFSKKVAFLPYLLCRRKVVTQYVMDMLGVSHKTACQYLSIYRDAGILREISFQNQYRVYEVNNHTLWRN